MQRLRLRFLWVLLLAPWPALADVPTAVTRLLETTRFEILSDPTASNILLQTSDTSATAAAVWRAYQREQSQNPKRSEADRLQVVHHGDKTMRYDASIIGQPSIAGYPLYIALHGGGTAQPSVNDSQWEHMKIYYKSSIQNGIYVAPRAISDTWDMHFQPDSYHLYKQLIAQMVLLHQADPDRVYLLGFSAGGDGVYQAVPRISDRLAAANMSAGHPNGVSLTNIQHVPLLLQVGEEDRAYKRNRVTAEYDAKIAALNAADPASYQHETFIHAGKGHNFYDNDPRQTQQPIIANPQAWLRNEERVITSRNTNAVAWLAQFSRDPLPITLVWDLSTVVENSENDGPSQHYWLDIGHHTAQSLGTQQLRACIDAAHNTIYVEGAKTYLKIWLNSTMLDLDTSVRIVLGGEAKELRLEANLKHQVQSVLTRDDPRMIFDTAVVLHQTPRGWETTAP
jgi:dienelactone hydrolase